MSRRLMRLRRVAWAAGAKIALTLGVMHHPAGRSRAPEYWTLTPLRGLEPGAPLMVAGRLAGAVVAVTRRGDTTFVRIRFAPYAAGLPGSREVRLRRLGASGVVALEMRGSVRPAPEPFMVGGLLRVLPDDLDVERDLSRYRAPKVQPLPPEPPPILQLMPSIPAASRASPPIVT